jgi:cell division protein FtsW (lipid II flippase)
LRLPFRAADMEMGQAGIVEQKSQTTLTWLTKSSTVIVRERALLALAGLFTFTGLALLAVVRAQSEGGGLISHVPPTLEPGWLAVAAAVWTACFAGIHLGLNRWHRDRDPLLLPVVALLVGLGLIEIARLAPNFLARQSLWLVVSTSAVLGVLAAPSDLRWLRRYKYTWLFIGLLLLALTFLIGVNPAGIGQTLWLGGLMGVFFQPVELLKLLFIAYLAAYLAEKREAARSLGVRLEQHPHLTLPYLLPVVAMWLVTLLLVMAQQDLGAAILLYLSFLIMVYLATGQLRYWVVGGALLIVAALGGYLLIGRVQGRIDTWLNPWADAAGSSYQIVQSLIAVASGGTMGAGLGQGWPHVILPAAHTDMPLAAIGEELGLLGALGVVTCSAIFTARGLRAAQLARATFGRLLAAGLASLIGLQAWLIMAGNANLAPLTGVPLPFVSYGGTSLLMSFISLGLLLQISADRR